MRIKRFNEEIEYNSDGFKFIRYVVNYDKEKTKEAQKLAFKYGYSWVGGGRNFLYLDSTYELDFNTKDKKISYCPHYEPEVSMYFNDDYINIFDYNYDKLENYFKTNGKGDQFYLFYKSNKKKNIYEKKKTIDLIVFQAKTDDDIVKAQEYAFQNGYTWYSYRTDVNYYNISQCKYFFYEIEDKYLTISSDLEDKSYDEFIKEYYDTENFIVIDDIDVLNYNLKTNGKSFHTYYNTKKLIYESVDNDIVDIVLFIPETEDECIEIQECAFNYGWHWYSGSTTVRNRSAKVLFFDVNYKDITYSYTSETPENIIINQKKYNNKIVKNFKNKSQLKYFLKTNNLESDFNFIYKTTNTNVYESIKPGIKYVDFLLPTDINEKQKYVNILIKKGWVKKQVNGNNIIVNNLEDANILHIFTNDFDKEFLLIRYENGIDNFINSHLSSYLDNVLKITDKKEFYDTFDESLINIFNYFDKKNIYD